MVKLDTHSPHNAKDTPFLHKWDTEYRANHETYQNEIDKITFHLQRAQRGFGFLGSWLYPNFFQRDFLDLDIYKKKQLIGKIFPEEVEAYVPFNANISSDLNKTFSNAWFFPKTGTAIGLGLNLVAHMFNFQYSFRLGIFVVPICIEYYFTFHNPSAKHNSNQFLGWLVEYRKSRAQLELENHNAFKDKELINRYRKAITTVKPVKDIYEDIVSLVASEGLHDTGDN